MAIGTAPLCRNKTRYIQGEPLSQKFPRYCLLWVCRFYWGWGTKGEKHHFLLALLLRAVLKHLSLTESCNKGPSGPAQLASKETFLSKSSKFLWILLVRCLATGNTFHSQGWFLSRAAGLYPPCSVLSPIRARAAGKDLLTAGNSFTCFWITGLQELQSRKNNLYCGTYNKRLEFITAGLLM